MGVYFSFDLKLIGCNFLTLLSEILKNLESFNDATMKVETVAVVADYI